MCIEVNGGGPHHHPPRARPQLLPARLQQAAGALPGRRQRRLPRGDRRHARALHHARVPEEDRAARQGAAGRRATCRTCCERRSTRSPSCRSACSSTSGAGTCSPARSTPGDYNAAWWELREKYQGVAAPAARSEAGLRSGRQVPRPRPTSPYTRYFLARILQFQFHRALCRAAGYKGPLHRCSIYGNKEAGEQARRRCWRWAPSRPWPEALEALTGERQMDATAILDYFAPLKTWLDEQNAGRQCGW